MKKFVLKLALFAALICVVDVSFGFVCDYLRDHTKGGMSGNKDYICRKSNEDIIMMGSSRMRHHYVPQMIEDSLDVTCYNAGIDGNGVIMSYGFLKMITDRYSPQVIIYDVSRFDIYKDDNTKYLGSLKAYYDFAGIDEIFSDVDKAENIKMNSRLYRYNSDLLGLLTDNIHPSYTFEKGYWPSHGVMDYEPDMTDISLGEVDELKIQYLEKFITLAKSKEIPLIFCASPTYHTAYNEHFHDPAKALCSKYEVPFLDFYGDEEISSNKKYFSNTTHLNDLGARTYTAKIISEVKSLVAL